MPNSAVQAQIDAATGYENLLVPALFEQWPLLVADAAKIQHGARVLDVACGTGVLAREALKRVGAAGAVTGLDPSTGMLALARRLAPEVDWREGVAEALPFEDESFDAVVSQFGFMFFTDRKRAAAEMLRVLKPGGHLAVAVWNSLENNPAYAREAELIEEFAGRAAADCIRAPFALGDPHAFKDAFPGNISVTVTTHVGSGRFPTVNAMLESDLRGWLPVLGIDLPEGQIQKILGEAARVLAGYVGPDGAVEFATSAHLLSASKL